MGLGRVLVVDDEASIRELCRVNLELEGFDVFEAGDGDAALEIARQERPHLVLLDVMMPGMDGWETLRRLREETPDIAVVMMTARTGEDDQLRAWGDGVLDYLAKPFNPLRLAGLAREAVDGVDPDEREARRQDEIDRLQRARARRRP